MKLQLGKTTSDIIISIYILVTLFIRFMLEPQLQNHYFLSMLLGGFGLLFLWALIKSKYLNPGWFGLLEPKEQGSPRQRGKT